DATLGGDAFDPAGDLYLGTREDLDVDRFFGGSLDSVQVYNRTLATDEVAGLAAKVNQATVNITANAVNDAPVLTGDLTASINEGATYAITGTDLGYTDPDDVDAGVTFTTSSASNGKIQVNGSDASNFTGTQLTAGQVTFVHDGSETTVASFDVNVEDGDEDISTPTDSTFNFTVTPVNDTPTLAASAANDTLTENTDVTSAAVFSTVTIDPIEIGDDIASAQLTIAGGIENTDTLTINGTAITGLSSDSGGAIAGGHSYSYVQVSGVVTITFAGSTNAAAAELVLENITYGIDAADQDPSTTARTVTLNTVTDNGGGSDTNTDISETATISVGAVNDTPTLAATPADDTLTENTDVTSGAVFPTVTIDPIETGDSISEAQVTLAGGLEDSDSINVNGTAITNLTTASATGAALASGGTYDYVHTTGVLTINFAGSTSAAAAEAILEAITFGIDASDNDPSTIARTVTLNTVTDNGGGSDTNTDISETATISVGATDDAIDTTTTGNTVTFTEDAGATTALFAASIDTIETGDTITQVILTLANVEAGDTLSFGATNIDLNTNGATGPVAGFTYTVSSAGATPVVTITHAGTDDASVNTMLNSAVFNNTANNDPSTTARTVTFTSVTDSGSGLTTDGTIATVNVVKADDAIVTTTTGNTVTFTEDAGVTTALFAASIDTIETGDTITQVILTLANVEAGDTLSFGATNIDLNTNGATGPVAGFTYTVSSAGATPVVTITHAGTDDATVNTMLNSAVFNNTANNDPSTTARTVTFTSVTDSGSGTTADGTVATVNVVKADEAIDTTTTANTVTFTEDAGATTALFAASIDTIETGDTISQVILTLANVEAGDTLSFGATDIDLNTNGATVAGGFTYTVSSAGA
ncbi:MAG: hypothetical protein GY926_20670, partial [bacterium]|nr:hypothetical protein [bacterium]